VACASSRARLHKTGRPGVLREGRPRRIPRGRPDRPEDPTETDIAKEENVHPEEGWNKVNDLKSAAERLELAIMAADNFLALHGSEAELPEAIAVELDAAAREVECTKRLPELAAASRQVAEQSSPSIAIDFLRKSLKKPRPPKKNPRSRR
jgi:hypothetical protein